MKGGSQKTCVDLQNTSGGRLKLFKTCKKPRRRWQQPSFGGCRISQHTYKQQREDEDHEDHETNKKNMKIMYIVPKNQKMNITRVKRHEAWGSWNQEKEHEKYVVPRNQETNITRVKRHKACISFKSHKPWKAQIFMKLKKLRTSQNLESSKLKKARRLSQGGKKLKDQFFCTR
jgi:hypothetical protein